MTNETNRPRVLRRSGGRLQERVEPIVFEYEPSTGKSKTTKTSPRSKDNRKYSEGLKDIQEVEGDLVRVARRATNAVAKGIDTYHQQRSRSASEKKDGALEDFPHNSAKAWSDGLKEASEIPLDLADAIITTNYHKRMRRGLRRASRMLRVFRL